MKEKRDRPFVGQVLRVTRKLDGMRHQMMGTFGPPLHPGCFSVMPGGVVCFHPDDLKLEREISYESVQRVSRTTKSRREKVRLRP